MHVFSPFLTPAGTENCQYKWLNGQRLTKTVREPEISLPLLTVRATFSDKSLLRSKRLSSDRKLLFFGFAELDEIPYFSAFRHDQADGQRVKTGWKPT